MAKTLKKMGRAGGFGRDMQAEFARRLIHPAHRVEPKGPGFYGMDMSGGNRAVFTLNGARQPVLVYFGHHAGYDRLNLRSKEAFNLEAAREIDIAVPKEESAVSFTEFTRNFLRSIIPG
jgi:hypothetical protein